MLNGRNVTACHKVVVCSRGAYCQTVAEAPRSQDFLSSPPLKNLDAEILLSAARNAVHKGDYPLAIERFERLLKQAPDQDQARLEYAGLLFQADRVREAEREYALLLKKYPDNLSLIRNMVDALLAIGDLPRVRQILKPFVEKHPDRTDFTLALAMVYARENDLSAARTIVERYIAGRPLPTDRMKIDAVELFTQMHRPDLAAKPLAELQRTRPNDSRVLSAGTGSSHHACPTCVAAATMRTVRRCRSLVDQLQCP